MASDLTQSLGSSPKNDRSISFTTEDDTDDEQNTTEDGEETLNPPPPRGQTKETSGDRTKRGSKERSSGEERHTEASLIGIEDIRDCTTGVGERRRTEKTGKETEDKEGTDVWSTGGSTRPEGKEGVRRNVDVSTTKDLG